MNNRDIEWKRNKLKEQRQSLESGQWNALRELVPDDVIEKLCKDCQYYFRVRLLSPLVIVFHMIGAGIHRERSFQSAWQLSGQSGRSGSLAKGRKRLPLKVWKRLDEWMTAEIDKEHSKECRWRGHRRVGVDGTCFSMSDEPELVEHFGRSGGKQGRSRFPVGRMSLAFDLGTLSLLGHEAGAYRKSEKELLEPLLKRLRSGDVLIGDVNFSGANLYAEYQEMGIEYITRVHASLNISRLEVLEEFGADDCLVKWKVGRTHRQKDTELPEWICVRMIRTEVKREGKKKMIWIATSLRDPQSYPAKEIVQQLKNRWKVEGLIEELKIWLGADVLRSRSLKGVYKELHARVIALNLMHWLILKAAKQHTKNPERLSLAATLRLSASYSLKMSTAPGWRLRPLYEEMLERIAHSTVPHRPDRLEPRMRKREHKRWPGLKISRTEWRIMHAGRA